MKTKIFQNRAMVRRSVAAILMVFAAGGTAAVSDEGNNPLAVEKTQALAKGGAQLWAENCARCHNYRSPTSYGNAQWEVVLQHMRVGANLTAEEYAKILDFLKSAKK